MNLKRNYILVFNPYVKPGDKRPYRYKVISANKLADYIGQNWADYLTPKLLNFDGDKKVFKLRHCGSVYAYRK